MDKNREDNGLHEPDTIVIFHKMMSWYQIRIARWVRSTFGDSWQKSTEERTTRFIEEAIELAQATGLDAEMIHKLVAKKYAEPKGVIKQEVGGVMITLLALCDNLGVYPAKELSKEFTRIHTPEVIAMCRTKVIRKIQEGIFGKGLKLERWSSKDV